MYFASALGIFVASKQGAKNYSAAVLFFLNVNAGMKLFWRQIFYLIVEVIFSKTSWFKHTEVFSSCIIRSFRVVDPVLVRVIFVEKNKL